MAIYTGVTGKLSIKKDSGTEIDIVHMASWSVELSKEILDVPSFGNDYTEKVPSIKSWSASSDGTADFDTEADKKCCLMRLRVAKSLKVVSILMRPPF